MNDYLYNPRAIMLHKKTKHTNKSVPYERHISGNTFPDQISELINTEVTLKYRDHHIIDRHKDFIPLGRPSDDDDYRDELVRPEDFDPHDVYEEKFRVVRADNSEPFILIGLSKDYSKVLVNSTRKINDDYAFNTLISYWPKQDDTYFGLDLIDKHTGEVDRLRAVTIRSDEGEPTYSILVEFLGSTNMIRVLLGDECISHIKDYYDEDYNMDAKDVYEYDNPIDIDGYYASHIGIRTTNLDGGTADNLTRLFFDRRTGNMFDEGVGMAEPVEEDLSYLEALKYEFGDLNDSSVETIEGDYDFYDQDEDSISDEEDDSEFNFTDEDIEFAKSQDSSLYEFGELEIGYDNGEGDYDFLDIDESGIIDDDDDGVFDFDDLDNPKEIIPDTPEPEVIKKVYKFNPIPILSKEEKINFRKMIFEGRIIYGSL